MLRVKILASAVPLLLAGVVAGGELVPGSRPCIALGRASMQIATAPWQNPLHVSFTDDPETATVRVQIVDSAELADFAIVDDMQTADADESCSVNPETSFVSIADHRVSNSEPVIYLSQSAVPITGSSCNRAHSACATPRACGRRGTRRPGWPIARRERALTSR